MIIMSYVSAQAKVYADSKQRTPQYNANKIALRIDRTETSFGGKGRLTKEQYEKGMSLARKMRTMSAW